MLKNKVFNSFLDDIARKFILSMLSGCFSPLRGRTCRNAYCRQTPDLGATTDMASLGNTMPVVRMAKGECSPFLFFC